MTGQGRQTIGACSTDLIKRLISYPDGHKITLSVFAVLVGLALIPHPFLLFAIFTHWPAFALTFAVQDLVGITAADIGFSNHQLFQIAVQYPILIAYSFLLSIWVGFVFANVGGRHHKLAMMLMAALVLWVAMPFIVSGIVNSYYTNPS